MCPALKKVIKSTLCVASVLSFFLYTYIFHLRLLSNINEAGSNSDVIHSFSYKRFGNQTWKYYVSDRDLVVKVQQFNDVILEYVRTDVDGEEEFTVSCDELVLDINRPFRILQGYTRSVLDILQQVNSTSTVIGSPDWSLKQTQVDVAGYVNDLGPLDRHRLEAIRVFNALQSQDDKSIVVLVLSSLSGATADVIDVRTPIEQYYECCISENTKTAGVFHNQSGSMSPTLCVRQCSTNLSVMNEPIKMPDYALHIDFTKVDATGTCADLNMPTGREQSIGELTLHHSYTADVLTSLTIVKNAFVLSEGQIRSTNYDLIEMFHCYDIENDVRIPLYDLSLLDAARCEQEVFSIAENWSLNYYHNAIDEMTRLAPFVWFLKQRPQLVIHIGPQREVRTAIVRFRKLFGLRHRFIWGVIKARLVYKPLTNPCFSPTLTNVVMTNKLARDSIRRNQLMRNASDTAPVVLYVRRKLRRRLTNEREVLTELTKLAQKTGRKLAVYDDGASQKYSDTLELFYRADVIVGPHGAGLSNIVFSAPGTTVVEIHCKGRETHMCFRMLALRLGLRYYATETTTSSYSWRCNESGINVDVYELRRVLNVIASYL